MNAADYTTKLNDLFTQAHLCVENLKSCLTLELESLKTSNAENLIKNSQTKESLMLDLQTIEKQRKELITENNITSKDEYLNWLDTLDSSGNLKNSWLELSQEILTCQKQNTENHIITESMSTATLEALNILSGNSMPTTNTYTSQGTKPESSASLHNTTA